MHRAVQVRLPNHPVCGRLLDGSAGRCEDLPVTQILNLNLWFMPNLRSLSASATHSNASRAAAPRNTPLAISRLGNRNCGSLNCRGAGYGSSVRTETSEASVVRSRPTRLIYARVSGDPFCSVSFRPAGVGPASTVLDPAAAFLPCACDRLRGHNSLRAQRPCRQLPWALDPAAALTVKTCTGVKGGGGTAPKSQEWGRKIGKSSLKDSDASNGLHLPKDLT